MWATKVPPRWHVHPHPCYRNVSPPRPLFAGYLCTTCADQFYRRANECQPCPTYAATLVTVAVPTIVLLVVVALLFAPLANSRMVSVVELCAAPSNSLSGHECLSCAEHLWFDRESRTVHRHERPAEYRLAGGA